MTLKINIQETRNQPTSKYTVHIDFFLQLQSQP